MNATLASGRLSTAGALMFSQGQEAMATSFTGDSAIAEISHIQIFHFWGSTRHLILQNHRSPMTYTIQIV
jgi:hypothetical protein